MHSRFLVLLLLAAATLAAQAQPDSALPDPALPQHPRLLFNAAGVARLKTRVQSQPWQDQWKRAQAAYDAGMKAPIVLPLRGSNWFHWYVCPTHGARLTTGKKIGEWQWEHICPTGHEVWKGDPSKPDRDFDGCILAGLHDGLARAVRQGGILYAVTGEARYAEHARDILLAYAAKYLDYPLHDTQGRARVGGGRLSPQTLDESVWLIPAAQGADLIWDTLSPADRKTITEKLFLPAARDVILPHRLGIHNIQNWKNSAVGLTGLLLGDTALIRAAIDDPDRGYRVQMAKGVQPDGVWFEGSWGYHAYTISAVWALVEAGRNCGMDLYGEPFKKMFEAPIQLAMPNLMLPAFNDSAESTVRNELYELAYARYHDPIYLAALSGSNRRNEYALWFGEDQLPANSAAALGSRNATASGYAILQRGEGAPATWLCLKYGPHGGGHGHPDKNNFILYARGAVLFPDPGTRPYGSPLHTGWDKLTLAHNTLVADEASQAEATGKSLAFGSDGGADFAMTDAGAIYPGVRFVRTAVLLEQNLVAFIDRITADQPHQYDLATHYAGKWRALPGGEAIRLAGKNGYQLLQDATSRPGGALSLQVEAPDGTPATVALAANAPTDVITATGVGKSTEDRIPVSLFRRTAQNTTYAWAVALDGSTVSVTVEREAGDAVNIRVENAGKVWKVAADPAAGSVKVTR